ncbi:hypothetical protein [Pseudobacteroides cellulosolvens]|nr:hypothetical protein [Pseudobacteroides cellulosolvens]KNY30190.1 hypothetical protein Bccel_5467 [Pseudobacteroides cellulosolvens ATCC 35603 = DSM 2933]
MSNEVESISSISEQNSAANEEFLASLEVQNVDMSNMLVGVGNINKKWNELKEILENS